MMKKKKQSRSQTSFTENKSLDPSSDSRILSIFRSKLASGKDLKYMLKGMRRKTVPGLSSQSRIVRCPKCQKLLQEPIDATTYKCSGCNSILQAKRWELESSSNSIPEALLSSQNWSLGTEVESAQIGGKTPTRAYHSETVNKHETSDIRREWMRRADEFSDTDVFSSARSSPYNNKSQSNASEWTQHDVRYEEHPHVPFYPTSPSPSSAYGYGGYNSSFRGSQASASEQSYYHHHHHHHHHHQQQPIHWSSQSSQSQQQYHNHYESSTSNRSMYSERSYQEAATQLRSTYYEHSVGVSKSETSSERSDKRRYVREMKPVVKRHVLPSEGGAPFATCSYCLQLLQLPSGSTVTIHQDSASEGHGDMYRNDDQIYKSNDDVIMRRNMKTFEDKETREVIRSVSSKFLYSKSKDMSREEQPASNETTGESLSFQIDQSEEVHSERLTKIDKPEEMFGNRSNESLAVKVYKSESSSEEAEGVSERAISHSVEPLFKNEYIHETSLPSENTTDFQEFEDSDYNSSSSNDETVEDTPIKEETEHISNTFSDSVNENQRITGHPHQSDEATTVTTSSIHGEKPQESSYENDNLKERQGLDKDVSDRVWSELEESEYETYEILEPSKEGEDGPVVSLETFEIILEDDKSEERSISPRNVTTEDSYGALEPVYLEGSTWTETLGDRAGLHLEEYESNYERAPTFHMYDYELGTIAEPEEDDDGRSESGSRCSSFNDHESLEENALFHESRDAKPDQSLYESSNAIFDVEQEYRYEADETLDSLEKASETNMGENGEETSISHQMEGNEYESERTWAETMGDEARLQLEEYQSNPYEWTSEGAPTFHMHEYDAERISISSSTDLFNGNESSKEIVVAHEEKPLLVDDGPSVHSEKCENQSMNLEETFKWIASERAPTFRLHEYKNEVGTMLEPDEDEDGRSECSSRGSFNDHRISTERDTNHEEDPKLVTSSRTEELQIVNVDKPFEWSSGRTLTFRSREYELGKMLESEESSSFYNHGSSNEGTVIHKDEPWLVDHNETEELKVGLMGEEGHSLHLDKEGNETVDLHESIETMDGTFRLCPEDTLEQEKIMFHLDISQENLRQTLTESESKEDIPESPIKTAELYSEAEEEISGDHLEPLKIQNDKSIRMETPESEIVGLRHALYQTQSSPLRSPLHSPIHTPIGSPLHYMMSSSHTINSHIVSPLRSPINSPGSLSDILFFGK